MPDWTAGAQVKITATDDGHVEIGVPWMDVPLVLEPGEQIMLRLGVGVEAQSYIDGLGWQ